MKEKLKRKLHSQAGESIGETLAALLISSLALVMLAGAMSAASGMIVRSRSALGEYYSKNEAVAIMAADSGTAATDGIIITDDSGTISQQKIDVRYYLNNSFGKNPVVSYKKSD